MNPNDVAIRKAYIDLCLSLDGNTALTLGEGLGASDITLTNNATEFFNRIQRDARGRNWAKRPPEQWPCVVGFIEPAAEKHLHVYAAIPPDIQQQIEESGSGTWKKIRRGGHFYCKPIENGPRYARYITKRLYTVRTAEEIFVYSPHNQTLTL